ncbi:MAG: sporulation transcriptional regulator SpoIIID [Clostridia bacterium]|nr:sporulation transcriptional regulator SpoIIID [Clostridia bacterium]
MKDEIILRVREIGEYIAATGATVRAAAKRFGISKSTVHKDMAVRLKKIDGELYKKVADILAFNRSERHIRGGMATKKKYKVDNIK